MIRSKSCALCLAATIALGACSSSGSSNAASQTYEALDSNANVESVLAGAALVRNASTGAANVEALTGQIAHRAGSIEITDQNHTISDETGFNGSGQLQGAGSILTQISTNAAFAYLFLFNETYQSGGTNFDSTGVIGVETADADIPANGSQTFEGEAFGIYATASSGFDLTDGTAEITANFGSGTVELRLFDFVATNQFTGAQADAPIGVIEVTDMSIEGSAFSGGTIVVDGTTDFAGATATQEAQGSFYGYDSREGSPDEVGGVISAEGSDAVLFGVFAAD